MYEDGEFFLRGGYPKIFYKNFTKQKIEVFPAINNYNSNFSPDSDLTGFFWKRLTMLIHRWLRKIGNWIFIYLCRMCAVITDLCAWSNSNNWFLKWWSWHIFLIFIPIRTLCLRFLFTSNSKNVVVFQTLSNI